MSKLVSVGLIAATMFASPAMAAWYDKNGAVSLPPASFTASGLQTKASLPEVRRISLPANRQPGAQAPGRRGATKTAQSSLPPASFTAFGLQTKASLPEVRGIILPANRQPGARRQVTLKARMGWAKSPVCPALPSSTSTPIRAKKAARCCQRSLRTECSMSGRFADAVRRRQIAGRRQGEQLAAHELPVLALHSRLLGGEPHPRWSVETAACQASTIGQLTTARAKWFRDANEDDIRTSVVGTSRRLAAMQNLVRYCGIADSRKPSARHAPSPAN